jgi:hypothetical protein
LKDGIVNVYSGLQHCAVWKVVTSVLEYLVISIFRVKEHRAGKRMAV